jgi:5-(carboxyamino)imidazole ribonucleotide synthase
VKVGVLGGGQLGRMLALAGEPLGLRFLFADPSPDTPARLLAEQLVGDYEDDELHHALAGRTDLVTYELENVPVAALFHLAEHRPVFPTPRALRLMQDRLREKRLCARLEIPVPPFRRVDALEDLRAAAAELGLPLMLKTRFAGYDGRGQRRIVAPNGLDVAFTDLGGRRLLAEPVVPFVREVSLIAVRGGDGAFAAYPLVENHHVDGILRWSRPLQAVQAAAWQRTAEDHARRIMQHLGYVGVMTIEYFATQTGLQVNELAPRVHNSGHWTIEGAATSQFENHLRAGLGWRLGDTGARGASLMVNLIGDAPDPARLLAIPGAHPHLYGKAPGPRRKLGHVTLTAETTAALAGPTRQLADALGAELPDA